MKTVSASPPKEPAPAHRARRPCTILHLTAPAAFGGLERVVATLARGQALRSHQVHVAAVVQTGDEAALAVLAAASGAGVTTHAIRIPARGYREEYRAIRRLVEAIGAEVVHTHGYQVDVIGALALRGRGAVSVSTVHGFTRGDVRNRLYERAQRRALRSFDAVVAVSRPIGAELIQSGVRSDRVHVVRNAGAADRPVLSRAEARQALGIVDYEYRLGWVGRLSREKGCDVALDALAELPDRTVRLSVLGAGPELAALRRRAIRLGLESRVTWHGAVPDAARVFPAFDAFVLSSRTEGTPITLLESMAAGVPVIATRVGGVPDVVGEAEALLVPSGQPAALTEAIMTTLRMPLEAKQRAARAALRLRSEFDPDRWQASYDAVYQQLLEKQRA